MNNTITITVEQFLKLSRSAAYYEALLAGGIQNYDWYYEVLDDHLPDTWKFGDGGNDE